MYLALVSGFFTTSAVWEDHRMKYFSQNILLILITLLINGIIISILKMKS